MNISQFCRRPAQTVAPDATVHEAAALMKKENVGCLVVVDKEAHPVGMLTDRDIAMNVGHHSKRLEDLAVGELMTRDPVTVRKDASLQHATTLMRDSAHRRLPVTSKSGEVEGVLSTDDLLIGLSEELDHLAEGFRRQIGTGERGARASSESRTTMHT